MYVDIILDFAGENYFIFYIKVLGVSLFRLVDPSKYDNNYKCHFRTSLQSSSIANFRKLKNNWPHIKILIGHLI